MDSRFSLIYDNDALDDNDLNFDEILDRLDTADRFFGHGFEIGFNNLYSEDACELDDFEDCDDDDGTWLTM